jgi:rubrerythrin
MNHISLFSELLSLGMRPSSSRVETYVEDVQVELPKEWHDFEETLGEFKDEYVKAISEMLKVEAEYNEMNADVKLLTEIIKQVQNVSLRNDLTECLQKFTERAELQDKKDKLAHLSGKVKAMDEILMNTNAKRYAQFTCPICTDRYVGIFLDPCGHAICHGCMLKLRDSKCPMCRTENVVGRRIYTS